MARRIRPPQPLAPHGLPGHLVGFVEALRAQGISVGPSETVDAGRVMSVLGLGDREVLREGLACAVLRRPDHRDTYDAMFDLWFPAALGARATVLISDDEESAASPDDWEALRAQLVELLGDQADMGDRDERMEALVAQIVEAYGRYSSSRGPSYSSYQALKAMGLDQLEGRLLAGLLAPYGEEPDAHARADRQSDCQQAYLAAAQDGGGRDQAAHRRAARPRARGDVRHSAALGERRVPAGLR